MHGCAAFSGGGLALSHMGIPRVSPMEKLGRLGDAPLAQCHFPAFHGGIGSMSVEGFGPKHHCLALSKMAATKFGTRVSSVSAQDVVGLQRRLGKRASRVVNLNIAALISAVLGRLFGWMVWLMGKAKLMFGSIGQVLEEATPTISAKGDGEGHLFDASAVAFNGIQDEDDAAAEGVLVASEKAEHCPLLAGLGLKELQGIVFAGKQASKSGKLLVVTDGGDQGSLISICFVDGWAGVACCYACLSLAAALARQ